MADIHFSSVTLLMNMAGTNGGTDAVDHSNSGHTPTYNGNAQLSNLQTLYQSTSLLLDGTGDWVSFSDNADFEPGTGPFTVDIRFRTPSSLSGTKVLVAKWAGGTQRSWALLLNGSAVQLNISETGSASNTVLSGGTLSPNTDYEVAFDIASDSDIRLYLDGALLGEDLINGGIVNNNTQDVAIGAFPDGSSELDSYIYEVRITKGVARYEGAYTPTTETYPTSALTGQSNVSQTPAYAGYSVTDPDSRVSQTPAYAGYSVTDPDSRVSQAVTYYAYGIPPDARASQTVVYAGRLNKTPCGTQRVTCWRITRTDGTVFRFTSHDEEVYITGEVYTPCNSLSRSAVEISSELGQTDNMDITGVISDTGVSEADLFAGAFDGAAVEVFEVDWTPSPVSVTTLAIGTAGRLQQGDAGYKFEVITASQKLQTKALLQQVTPSCRWELGSSNVAGSPGCGVDLGALEVSGTVTSVAGPNDYRQSPKRTFTDTSRSESTDYFKLGVLTWTTGGNAGLSVEVKEFGSGEFTLWQELRTDIKVGDQYTVKPGCNKLVDGDCLNKFNNVENFGGFPFLPGRDFIQKRGDR